MHQMIVVQSSRTCFAILVVGWVPERGCGRVLRLGGVPIVAAYLATLLAFSGGTAKHILPKKRSNSEHCASNGERSESSAPLFA